MKKIILIPMILVLAVICTVTPIVKSQQTFANTTAVAEPSAASLSCVVANIEFTPMSTQGAITGPHDIISNPVYTESGEQIFMLKELGLLVLEDGRPVVDFTNSSITQFNMETQEYLNGAAQKLSYYRDSFLDRYYLVNGGTMITDIGDLNREIFLINFHDDEKGIHKKIYTYREKVKGSFWKPNTWAWAGVKYRYYDLNGRYIDPKYIKDWTTSEFMKTFADNMLWFLVNPVTFFATLFSGKTDQFMYVHYVEIFEHTTLGDLREEVEHITKKIYDQVSSVITEDGSPVFVRPSSGQCVDLFNMPLFSITNGLPIIYYEGGLFTTNFQEVEIKNGILKNAISEQTLRENGTDTYCMGIVETPFGVFDAIVINIGTKENPVWVLPNGASANGVILDMQYASSQDRETEKFFAKIGNRMKDDLKDFFKTIIKPFEFVFTKIGNFLGKVFWTILKYVAIFAGVLLLIFGIYKIATRDKAGK